MAPGAGVPTSYRIIPWLLLAWLAVTALIGMRLRRRRDIWDRMGRIFD